MACTACLVLRVSAVGAQHLWPAILYGCVLLHCGPPLCAYPLTVLVLLLNLSRQSIQLHMAPTPFPVRNVRRTQLLA